MPDGASGDGKRRVRRHRGRRRQRRLLRGARRARRRAPRCSCWSARPRPRAAATRRFTAGAMRVVYDGVDDLRELMPDLTDDEIATNATSAPTPRSSSSTTWSASPSTAPTPTCAKSWCGRASRRWCGCAARACASSRSTAARRSRSTAGSSSGAAWRSRPGAAAPAWSTAETQAAASAGHRDPLRARRAVGLLHDDARSSRRARSATAGAMLRHRAPGRWCSPPAASRPTPRCAPATSARAGTWRRCAAPASTPATASGWRSTSAPAPSATGRAATRCGWDFNAPEFGDLAVGDGFQKHSYPLGIMVNADGQRFVDEGADFRNYTYAKYGRVILAQPGKFAWQVFDQKVAAPAARRVPHPAGDQGQRRHAGGAGAAGWRASTPSAFLDEIRALQRRGRSRRAVQPERQGRPRHARAWRSQDRTGRTRIDTPPFEAYAVTCGITFTFGGLSIDDRGAGGGRRPAPDPRPLRRRRAGGRDLLLQLSGRHRPDLGRRVRPPGGRDRRRRCAEQHGRRGAAAGRRCGVARKPAR